MKICNKCNFEKENLMFSKHRGTCKSCIKNYKNIYNKLNKDKISIQQKSYYENNKEVILEYHKVYSRKNKEKLGEYRNKYEKIKRATDLNFKLRKNCSNLIRQFLNGKKSNSSILNYLPYSIEELKYHLEDQFDNKMSWNNYGTYWHIDHIYPQSLLPYNSMNDENFKISWNLNNLRPLEAIENIRKSNNIGGINGKK